MLTGPEKEKRTTKVESFVCSCAHRIMSLTVERIKEMFAPLAGEGGSFLENVAEDVKYAL